MTSPIFSPKPLIPREIQIQPVIDQSTIQEAKAATEAAKHKIDAGIVQIAEERLPLESNLSQAREEVFQARRYVVDTATSQAWFGFFVASVALSVEEPHHESEIEHIVEEVLGLDDVTGGALEGGKIAVETWDLGWKISDLVKRTRLIKNAKLKLEALQAKLSVNPTDKELIEQIQHFESLIEDHLKEAHEIQHELALEFGKYAVGFSKDLLSILHRLHMISSSIPAIWWLNKTIGLVEQALAIKKAAHKQRMLEERIGQAEEAMYTAEGTPELIESAKTKAPDRRTQEEESEIEQLEKLLHVLNQKLGAWENSVKKDGVAKLKALKDKREAAEDQRLAARKTKLDQALGKATRDSMTSFINSLKGNGIDLLQVLTKMQLKTISKGPENSGWFSSNAEPANMRIIKLIAVEAMERLAPAEREMLQKIFSSGSPNEDKYAFLVKKLGENHPLIQMLNSAGKDQLMPLTIDQIRECILLTEPQIKYLKEQIQNELPAILNDEAVQTEMIIQMTRHQDAMTVSAKKGLQTLQKGMLLEKGPELQRKYAMLKTAFYSNLISALGYGILTIIGLTGTSVGVAIFFPFILGLTASGTLMCLGLYYCKRENPNLFKGFWNVSLLVWIRYDRRQLAKKQTELGGLTQRIYEKTSKILAHNTLYYQLKEIELDLQTNPNAIIRYDRFHPIVRHAYNQLARSSRNDEQLMTSLKALIKKYQEKSFANSQEINEMEKERAELLKEVEANRKVVEDKTEEIRKAVWADFMLHSPPGVSIDTPKDLASALINENTDPESEYMKDFNEVLKDHFNIDFTRLQGYLGELPSGHPAIKDVQQGLAKALRNVFSLTPDEFDKSLTADHE